VRFPFREALPTLPTLWEGAAIDGWRSRGKRIALVKDSEPCRVFSLSRIWEMR
jgi:hypothetical protein